MNTSSVMQEVNRLEDQKDSGFQWKLEARRFAGIILGSVMYCLGVNLFLRPLHLYSGGMMGFSQLFTNLLYEKAHLVTKLDVAGIIYYTMNIPGLIIALRTMRGKFVIKTILTVTFITFLLTLIPIPQHAILEEKVANCLVAGVIIGIGSGLILQMGSCAGGNDLIGMILIHNKGILSVGRITIYTNIVLYGFCLVLYDIPTVIYSMLYSVMCSTACDRFHTQNINVEALIVTKLEDISALEIEIMGQTRHGLTKWEAKGSYTGENETVLMTVISKYEIAQLKSIVHQFDPHAFVIIGEGVGVYGHFIKKVT